MYSLFTTAVNRYLCAKLTCVLLQTVATTGRWVVYSMLHLVLHVFHEDTLADYQGLLATVAKLLTQPNLSEHFYEAFIVSLHLL